MLILLIFSFVAGLVTILSPCILPLLPIILSTSIGDSKPSLKRPLGVISGFIISFTFFTLFLTSIVRTLSIPADSLRLISVVVIAGFGLSMLIPKFQQLMEIMFSKLSSLLPRSQPKSGYLPGVVVGLSLGLLWTPCVGPILASVISLALTGQVSLDTILITFAYSLGTAIPMFLIMIGGQGLLRKAPILLKNTANIQKVFGVVMIVTAIAIFFGFDRKFQTFILDKFPNYGTNLTKFEEKSEEVKNQLEQLINPNSNDPKQKSSPTSSLTGKPAKGVMAPELVPTGDWFNSSPLSIASLKGKVILVDFWTYTCINCIRTLPYLQSWHEKYSSLGLMIIGVHSPEFEFEKSSSNVKKAIEKYNLAYPVVQDNEFKTWRAYSNRYWPAKYLIDADGQIRYTHFGEGEYDETEMMIQTLLQEKNQQLKVESVSNPTYQVSAKTPELYLGYERIAYLRSPEQIIKNKLQSFSVPSILSSSTFAYSGDWVVSSEYSTPQQGAKLILNFEAKQVFLVMRAKAGMSKVRVGVNGSESNLSEEVKDGILTVDTDKIYEVVRLNSSGVNKLELEFLDSNTEVYAFTFG